MNAFKSFVFCPPTVNRDHDVSADQFIELDIPPVPITTDENSPKVKIWSGVCGDPTKTETSTPILVYCYGNATYSRNLGTFLFATQIAFFLARSICPTAVQHVPFVMFDYPGYPRVTPPSWCQVLTDLFSKNDPFSVPSEDSAVNAAKAVVEEVTKKYPGHPIILMGRSMGTAIAFRVLGDLLTSKDSSLCVHGAIMVSPMYSGKATIQSSVIYNFIPSDVDVFNTKAVIHRVNDALKMSGKQWLPLILFHGTSDNDVPVEHSSVIQKLIGPRCSFFRLNHVDHVNIRGSYLYNVTRWYEKIREERLIEESRSSSILERGRQLGPREFD
jgi:hypothetical protein